MTTGRVRSTDLMSSTSLRAIGTPISTEVPSGISLPIDHMITDGEFLAACTISSMSASLCWSKKRP